MIAGRRSRRRAATLLSAVALVAGVLVGSAACSPTPSASPGGPTASTAAIDGATPGPSSTPAAPVPVPKHEVYGFIPYWEMDAGIADHVRGIRLSTLGLFSVTHRRNGSLATNQVGYRRISGRIGDDLIRAAHTAGSRVEVVYTSFGETKNRRFYAEPDAQTRWIGELVDLTLSVGADGVNVDVEGLPADLVPAYGAFVGSLRTALLARLPTGQVSVATTPGPGGAAMAAAAVAAGVDRVFLMGYDYHSDGSEPGATSPLEEADGETLDLRSSLDLYALAGVPPERTLLGLPLFGLTWPVEGPGYGAAATGRGNDWVPRRNLRVFADPSFEPTYDPVASVEFYSVPRSGGKVAASAGAGPGASVEPGVSAEPGASAPAAPGAWDAVYFDSPRSLTPKLALADQHGLAGAGFWAIGYERGLPGYDELIATFRAGELSAP